jgi:hypothetical protein
MALRLLEDISQVQVGDYFANQGVTRSNIGLGTVKSVREIGFSYDMPYGMAFVRKESLPGVVLLRKTPEGLEVLAGKEAYDKLTRK